MQIAKSGKAMSVNDSMMWSKRSIPVLPLYLYFADL
jgi:hypothetical protein